MSTVSYTLRIPEELRRMLETKAEECHQSVASLIIGACWARLQRDELRFPSKVELDGMGFTIPEGATVTGFSVERVHDKKTCRIYGCLLCKEEER